MDHLPTISELNISVIRNECSPFHDFRKVDWEEFREKLEDTLSRLPSFEVLDSQEGIDETARMLIEAMKETIEVAVPILSPCPFTKRWWTKELTEFRKKRTELVTDPIGGEVIQ